MPQSRFSIGLDFGTESVRALIVDVANGAIAGSGADAYKHGVIDSSLPGSKISLPPSYALQHPQDWLDSAAIACRAATKQSRLKPEQIIGLGVDFTSCTMLPARRDGTPLCLVAGLESMPLAWPKLWKHHGAKAETDRMNAVAKERAEPWLNRYGGTIGIEWFFPKMLETLNHAPAIYDAAEVWVEAGDWFIWQLVDGPFPRCAPENLARSTCQAGYKACWNRHDGYPSEEYLRAVEPKFANVVKTKMPGQLIAPGERAGTLSPAAAALLGLNPGIAVSAATIDAHAGVPGAGVAEDGVMVLVMGTSSCHMMNSTIEKNAPGIAGIVQDGILPGYFGYETGQASVGDAFAWLARTVNRSHEELNNGARLLPPGSGGVLALDWLNGCRTPLMDGRLTGGFIGITLSTTPQQLYRALMEATAFGVRRICDTLRDAGVPVNQFVASGGLPGKSPLLMQIYSNVLNAPIAPAGSDQSVALGAAILGALAAGPEITGHAHVRDAIGAMAPHKAEPVYRPEATAAAKYDALYALYLELGNGTGTITSTMRKLHDLA